MNEWLPNVRTLDLTASFRPASSALASSVHHTNGLMNHCPSWTCSGSRFRRRPAAKRRKSAAADAEHITEAQVVQARMMSAQTPGKSDFGPGSAFDAAPAGETEILSAVARSLNLPFEQPAPRANRAGGVYRLLPTQYIPKHGVIPLRFDGDRLVVGVIAPHIVFLLDEVRQRTGRQLKISVTTPRPSPAADRSP